MRSESPPEPDRPRAVAPHAGALSLVVVSAVLLGIALKRPTVFFQGLGGPEEIYSIYGGTESLWKDGNRVSATIVFAFSIVFPVGKLAFLAFCCLRGHVRKRCTSIRVDSQHIGDGNNRGRRGDSRSKGSRASATPCNLGGV